MRHDPPSGHPEESGDQHPTSEREQPLPPVPDLGLTAPQSAVQTAGHGTPRRASKKSAERIPGTIQGTPHERARIYREYKSGMFAAERIVYINRPDIHTRHVWSVDAHGHMTTPLGYTPPETGRDDADVTATKAGRGTDSHIVDEEPSLVALDVTGQPLTLPTDPEDPQQSVILTSAIEVARQIEGPVAARMVHILYQMASDPPNWRQPIIEVDTNDFMDRLGYERSNEGRHQTVNRERVRDRIVALQRIEVRARVFDPAMPKRSAMFRGPLIDIRAARYDDPESEAIPLRELLERGLPSKLLIELRWYNGVRTPTGALGNNYVLLPRLSGAFSGQADHSHTAEALMEFLYLKRSLSRNSNKPIRLTRATAMRRAGITTENVTRARKILEKALDHLVDAGIVLTYDPVPKRVDGSFTVTIATSFEPEGTRYGQQPVLEQQQRKARRHSVAMPDSSSLTETPTLWDTAGERDDHGEVVTTDTETSCQHPGVEVSVEASAETNLSEVGYYEELSIKGSKHNVRMVWTLIKERAEQQRLRDAAKYYLRNAKPIWRVESLLDSDVRICFVLRISPGVLRAAEGAIGYPVRQALRDLFPAEVVDLDFEPLSN